MERDECGALFFLDIVVFAIRRECAVVEKCLELFALHRVIAEAVENALHAFAALLAFLVGFASASDPWKVINLLEQFT